MNHYTYLLQSQTSDMMYIGVRSSECLPEQDNYWGSSKYLPEDVSETFDKFILGRFDTREEAVADEIHRHKMNDVAKNPLFYNRARQTSNGYDRSGVGHSEETKIKISESHKGMRHTEETKYKIGKPQIGKFVSLETRRKLSENHHNVSGINHPLFGIGHTEETKIKMSANHRTKNGFDGGMIGKTHSEETKKLMSESQKGKTKIKVACPKCGVMGGLPSMKRWHFDNCKTGNKL